MTCMQGILGMHRLGCGLSAEHLASILKPWSNTTHHPRIHIENPSPFQQILLTFDLKIFLSNMILYDILYWGVYNVFEFLFF